MAQSTIPSQVSAPFFALLVADVIPAFWEATLLSLASTSRAHYAALMHHRYQHSDLVLPSAKAQSVAAGTASTRPRRTKVDQAKADHVAHLMRSWHLSLAPEEPVLVCTEPLDIVIPSLVQTLIFSCPSPLPVGLPLGLTRLEIPLADKVDVCRLAQCITTNGLPRLATLKLEAIPDLASWWTSPRAVMPRLGEALLGLAPTLRELDVSLVNSNRPARWDDSRDVFPRPEEVGEPCELHFDILFPGDKDSELPDSRPIRFELDVLRLRHFGIPEDAFDWVFDVSGLRVLELPFCAVAPAAWADLTREATLLKDVVCTRPYDDGSGKFKTFLGQLMWNEARVQVPRWCGRWVYTGLWQDGESRIWQMERVDTDPWEDMIDPWNGRKDMW